MLLSLTLGPRTFIVLNSLEAFRKIFARSMVLIVVTELKLYLTLLTSSRVDGWKEADLLHKIVGSYIAVIHGLDPLSPSDATEVNRYMEIGITAIKSIKITDLPKNTPISDEILAAYFNVVHATLVAAISLANKEESSNRPLLQ